MKSASSSSNLRNAWFNEISHRFIVIPVVSFITYFIATILPIILNYSAFENVASYTAYTLRGSGATVFIGSAMAIITSAAVFSYLHDSASAVVVHSMPFGRRKLFTSSFISGFIMMLIPIIATGILFMLVSGAHVSTLHGNSDFVGILTFSHSLKWMLDSIIVVTFVYVMSNLAGIMAGTRLIHVLLAMFINGAPYCLLLIVRAYAVQFFFGYPSELLINKFYYVSAVTYSISKDHYIGTEDLVPELIYIGVIIAVTLLTIWLYNKVKLERVRSACVFPVVSDILCVLLTFMGMSLGSIILTLVINSDGTMHKTMFLIIAAGLSVVLYIICRMIADGTTKIFNRSSYKKFGIYIVLVAVFFAFTVFDVSGFSTKTPSVKDVTSVELTGPYTTMDSTTLTDENSIAEVIALQKSFINNRYTDMSEEHGTQNTLTIKYHKKNGLTTTREYDMCSGKNQPNRLFEKLYNTPAFQAANAFKISSSTKINSIVLSNEVKSTDGDYVSSEYDISRRDYNGLIEAINKDISNRTYKEVVTLDNTGDCIAEVDIDYNLHEYGSSDYDGEYSTNLYITKGDKYTIAYLKDAGYWRKLAK